MKQTARPSVLGEMFWFLWARFPADVSKTVSRKIKKSRSGNSKFIWFFGIAVIWILSFTAFLFSKEIYGLLRFVRVYGVLFFFGFLYLLYFGLSFPFFMLFVYFSKEDDLEILGKDVSAKKKEIRSADVLKGRDGASKDEVYLGSSFWTGKPVYLSEDMRLMHTHVVGSTGSGKTDSVLISLLRRDIKAGRGAIILDAKGDYELLAKIKILAKESGRSGDFLFFSLAHPELSNTYNPLLRGNASEIKDKLIGATEWREEFYRKKAEEALLTLLRPMKEIIAKGSGAELAITFRSLYDLLTNMS
ncbi:MAG: type IV secretory system conjugative DNA transfer family protein, partial [Planctomycetes bacterium]|nr:type IV secretory system conjugative DNA transfer family protein [Planctomycetota bacterium]